MIKLFKHLVLCLALLPCLPTQAQRDTLGLERCYALADGNYPLIKKQDLIHRSTAYSLSNASRLYLPQLSVTGQGSYQSETVQLPTALGTMLPPGASLPEISKDQYKLQAELTQTIYDGGTTSAQKAYIQASEAVQQQSLAVSLYAIHERVNQLFFSILLITEQLTQNETRKADLQSAIDKASAALANGAAFRSTVDELKAEMINADMSSIEFRANRASYLRMLSTFIGKPLSDSTQLLTPAPTAEQITVNRPELNLYTLQKNLYSIEEKRLRADYLPRLSAFFQGAYGKPTLNILNNKAGAWYITGARLSWNLGSLYTLQNNKRTLELNRQQTDVDKETFLLNTQLTLEQESGDIRKYRELMQQDEKAIALRSSVKKASQAQLDNGMITTHDYIAQLNAENIALQTRILHAIQLLQAQYQLKHTTGN